MLIQLDTHSGIPIYRQVMDQVTRAVMAGHLKAGQQIDSVADLSRRLRVNPMTISKAYGFLVAEGLLERRAGVGLFVRSINASKTRKTHDKLLDDSIRKAAALALQLGFDEAEATQLFIQHFQKQKSQQEG